MRNALATFNASIADAKNLSGLYDFLTASIVSPLSYEDLLRSQIVYSVSAFDKLMHDLIRIGMVAAFVGTRPPTVKYFGESITIELHGALVSATVPPKEYVFEQEVVKKLRVMSFQDPVKVAEGLSFIWDEKHKWQKISGVMGQDADDVRKQLKLISVRRNAIVHESDIDPFSNTKTSITRVECAEVTDFLSECGNAIGGLVI